RYTAPACGPLGAEEELFGALECVAVLVRNPSSLLAWSVIGLVLLLFAIRQSRLLSAALGDLLKPICSADGLHRNTLGQWLGNDEARTLLVELVKQGSLELADEE